MSYEGKMLLELNMPTRKKVEQALLITLFKHNGVIKEFATGEEIVEEIANDFSLTERQRIAQLETVYKKENRLKKSSLWHRLLFRAADSLAKEKLVSRPSDTILLTNKREWMLTEEGFDKALNLLSIPTSQKEYLAIKSVEVEKIVKEIKETPRPKDYNPFDSKKKIVKITKEYKLRLRGFRQVVLEAYDFRCAICGLKLKSPKSAIWEAQAAHIVPHNSMGKDDIWNGLSLCRLHHWAFDVGWFTLNNDYSVQVSSQSDLLPGSFGKMYNNDFIKLLVENSKIFLPKKQKDFPHINSILWHRQFVFNNK